MKTIVHVNQHVIKANQKTGERNPVLTCKTYKTTRYGHTAEINGKVRIIYRPDKPLSCGATVWIETDEHVIVNGEAIQEKPEQKQLIKSIFIMELAAMMLASQMEGALMSNAGFSWRNPVISKEVARKQLMSTHDAEGKPLDGDSDKDLQLYIWR